MGLVGAALSLCAAPLASAAEIIIREAPPVVEEAPPQPRRGYVWTGKPLRVAPPPLCARSRPLGARAARVRVGSWALGATRRSLPLAPRRVAPPPLNRRKFRSTLLKRQTSSGLARSTIACRRPLLGHRNVGARASFAFARPPHFCACRRLRHRGDAARAGRRRPAPRGAAHAEGRDDRVPLPPAAQEYVTEARANGVAGGPDAVEVGRQLTEALRARGDGAESDGGRWRPQRNGFCAKPPRVDGSPPRSWNRWRAGSVSWAWFTRWWRFPWTVRRQDSGASLGAIPRNMSITRYGVHAATGGRYVAVALRRRRRDDDPVPGAA